MNPWKRNWLFYEARMEARITRHKDISYYGEAIVINRITRLGWFSYHLIKFIHGEQRLIELAETDRDGIKYKQLV